MNGQGRRRGGWATAVFCLLVFLVPHSAFAQTPSPTPQSTPASETAAAPPAQLIVLNRPIVTFRATTIGLPPAERAAAARQRIEEELNAGAPGVVTTLAVGDAIAVQLDRKLAFFIIQGDANPLLEQTPQQVAAAAAEALQRVVRESQEARDTGARWRAIAMGLVYLVMWLVAVWAFSRLRRLFANRFAAYAATRAASLKVGGAEILEGAHARRLALRVLGAIYVVVALVAGYEILGLILRGFPYTRPWGEQLNGFFATLLARILNGVAAAAPGVMIILLIFVAARVVLGIGRLFFDRVRQQKIELTWLDPDLSHPTQRIFTVVVCLFAFAMAYPYFPGSGSAAFDGLSVIVGLMVSLGGASAVGQAISGLMLMYVRTFRVGDFVRIDSVQGTVVGLSALQTRLRTGMGEEVVLANSRVIGAEIHNFSRSPDGPGIGLSTGVTIGYDTPWRQVHALLLDAAKATPMVARTPTPRVFQIALSDFFVEYRLACLTVPEFTGSRWEALSVLHANVQDAFNDAGVQIMSPHYEADPESPKIVRPQNP